MNKINLTKEEILEKFKNDFSIRDILRSLGYNSNGSGAYRLFHQYCRDIELDLKTYKPGQGNRRNASRKKEKSITDVFIVNSTLASAPLRRKILKYSLIEYKCHKCSNLGEWQGENLSLQLDHINGINNDNRLENLRFLCPNCHSQTSTYGSKRLKKRNL